MDPNSIFISLVGLLLLLPGSFVSRGVAGAEIWLDPAISSPRVEPVGPEKGLDGMVGPLSTSTVGSA